MFLDKQEKKYLTKIEKKIKNSIKIWNKLYPGTAKIINKINSYVCINKNAKRIRPMLSFYFCQMLNKNSINIINISVAIELIHNASIMHDDILDNAKKRRGKKTVNKKFDNSLTLLTGNHLLTTALNLLKNYKNEIIKKTINTIIKMNRAAITEVYIRGNINSKIKLCKYIIVGKTAELFSLCGELIIIFFNKLNEKKNFKKCGKHLGITFQLINDLENLIKKNKNEEYMNDMINKEPSYPIILLIKKSKFIKKNIKKLWNKKKKKKKITKKIIKKIKNKKFLNLIYKKIKKEILISLNSIRKYKNTEGFKNINKWVQYLLFNVKSLIVNIK